MMSTTTPDVVVPGCGPAARRTGAQWPTHRHKRREASRRRGRLLVQQRAAQAAELDRRVSR